MWPCRECTGRRARRRWEWGALWQVETGVGREQPVSEERYFCGRKEDAVVARERGLGGAAVARGVEGARNEVGCGSMEYTVGSSGSQGPFEWKGTNAQRRGGFLAVFGRLPAIGQRSTTAGLDWTAQYLAALYPVCVYFYEAQPPDGATPPLLSRQAKTAIRQRTNTTLATRRTMAARCRAADIVVASSLPVACRILSLVFQRSHLRRLQPLWRRDAGAAGQHPKPEARVLWSP